MSTMSRIMVALPSEDLYEPQHIPDFVFRTRKWLARMDSLPGGGMEQADDDRPVRPSLSAVSPRHRNWPGGLRALRNHLRKSRSLADIPMGALGIHADESSSSDSDEHPLRYRSNYSLREVLGKEVNEDLFQKEVAQKTQAYMVGQQEAETEVMIDRLIEREGNKDKALLYVVSQMSSEMKVHVFVNILLHRGAHPSFADQKWQTPLHHAAHRGFIGVVRKLLDHDALANARDKDKMMPFHFAFARGDDDISSMLIKFTPNHIVRELFLCKGEEDAECTLHLLLQKQMMQTALAVLDSLADKMGTAGPTRVYYHLLEADEKGRPPTHLDFEANSRSCLHLISKGGYKDLVFHFVVRLLIRRKWKDFARLRFQLNSFLYLVTLLCLTFSVVVSVVAPDPTVYQGPLQLTRAVFEGWCLAAAILTFIIEMNQMRKHRLEYWRDQFNWIDFASSVLLITVVPLRFSHQREQWPVFAIGYLLWTLRIFKYAAIFRQTGAYAQILWRIVSHDFLQFMVVFTVILIAFSGTFVLSLRGEDALHIHSETSDFWNVLFTGVRILIEGEPVVDYFGQNGFKAMSCAIMVVFLFVCSVVLLNILIAQLSDTYQNVQQDAQRGVELNRAWIIARVELNSLFIGKGYRITKYKEMEELNNPINTLEKWESPLVYEIGKNVREIKENLESTKLNILTVKNRLSRQEYALTRIQQQLDALLQLQPVPEIRHGSGEATNQD